MNAIASLMSQNKFHHSINDTMHIIYRYFNKVAAELEKLDQKPYIEQYSDKYPQFSQLKQHNPTLSSNVKGVVSDSHTLSHIHLKYLCVGEGAFNLNITSDFELDSVTSFFRGKNVPFQWNKENTLSVEKKIPVMVGFIPDIKAMKINLMITNHINFEVVTHSFNIHQINNTLLDELVKFLLRMPNNFQIEESNKEEELLAIRARLNEIKPHDTYHDDKKPVIETVQKRKRFSFTNIKSLFQNPTLNSDK
jgi:hypothetical protein